MAEHRQLTPASRLDNPHYDALTLAERDLENVRRGGIDLHTRSIRVGSHVASFRFYGPSIEAQLFDAIAHLEVADAADPTLRAEVWDSASAGVALSPMLQLVVDAAGFETLSPRLEVTQLTSDQLRASVIPWDGTMTLHDVVGGNAVYWTPDAATIPYFERAAAFRTLLHWWLSDHGVQCVHAAAVGTSDGAVLLTGRGGSGKSTTALACLGSELSYIGDDYCAVTDGGEVHSLYNTAKLGGRVDLDRQPHLEPFVVNADRLGDEKAMMYVQQIRPDALLRSAPLRAIVLPAVTGAERPKLERVSGGVALRALAPTSMFQLPGAGTSALQLMAGLIRSVPCYRLEVGPDLTAIAPTLATLVS